VPVGPSADFSLNWMEDKLLLQRTVTRIALALVDAHELSAAELVRIFELCNGREIAARIAGADGQPDRSASAILARHAAVAAQTGRRVETFFFVDGPDTVRLGHVTSDDGATMVHLESLLLDTEEIRAIRASTLGAFAAANPANLGVLDKKLGPWNSLSEAIWAAIQPCVRPGRHVVFLPGHALTGLPLHIAGTPGGPALIESTPVSYAPNFATLHHDDVPVSEGRYRPIIVVTKRTDTEHFRRQGMSAAQALSNAIDHSQVIEGTDADRSAVTGAMPDAAEMIFICHGVDAGPAWGHAICLADSGELPPSLLPVEHAPELRRFALTWDDLGGVRPTPALIVSTACSTAQTRVLEGGARLGLEQTLFASGTEQIVSPLWDVNQAAALEWLKLFYRHRATQLTAEDAYRAASLDLRASFPHMFYWAPFIINGKITNGG
jgi:hypothetical protein